MIDNFLRALENRLGKPKDTFIVKNVTIDTKFPVYKHLTQEVYMATSSDYECLSKVEKNISFLDTAVYNEAVNSIEQSTIENLLKRYGL